MGRSMLWACPHDLLSSGKAFLSFQFVFLHPELYYILCFIVTPYYYSFPWKSFINWPKRGTIINLCIAVRQIISLTSIRATFMNYSLWIYFLLWHCSELIKLTTDHNRKHRLLPLSQHYLLSFLMSVQKILFFHPSFCLLPKALPFFPASRKVMKYWCWNCPDPKQQNHSSSTTTSSAVPPAFIFCRSRWIVMHLEQCTGGEYSHT